MPVYPKNACLDKNLIFIHIPRTGGTHIQSILSQDIGTKELTVFKDIQPHDFGHYTYDNVMRTLCRNKRSVQRANYFVFTFVRNPFDKILSFYLNYTVNNTPDFDEYIDMVRNVVHKELYLNQTSIGSNDLSHYIPQTTMLGPGHVDFVGRFESFQKDINRPNSLVKIDALKHVQIRKRMINYKEYYSLRNRRIIEDIYRVDFSTLSYSY